MSRLVLHHCHQARSMRSLWLMNELGLDFELRVHDFFDLRTPDYLVLHALGRVPLLEDGELRLHESGAICEYLCETYDTRHLWRAPSYTSTRPRSRGASSTSRANPSSQ